MERYVYTIRCHHCGTEFTGTLAQADKAGWSSHEARRHVEVTTFYFCPLHAGVTNLVTKRKVWKVT